MILSAIKVAANEDLLIEILIRLPVKPLFRFKCVSKQWLSLITDPHLCRRKNPNNKVIGLVALCQDKSHKTKFVYDVIPLHQSPKLSHAFISRSVQSVDRKRTEILDSCNGLMCFRFDENFEEKYDYYVCNPTTRQVRKLPRPNHTILPEEEDASFNAEHVNLPTDPDLDSDLEGLNPSASAIQLAFDPRKSSNYKVVCLYFAQNDVLEMEIYSSETGLWRRQMCEDLHTLEFVSPESGRWMCIHRPLYPKSTLNIKKGIYWNGAMNWLNFSKGDGLYFNFDEERFGKWPILPLSNGLELHKINYFGGSHDHMFIAVFDGPNVAKFDVYEMDSEYSGWSIRYHVDVEVLMKSPIYPTWLGDCGFDIISVVLGDSEEDSFVVIGIPGLAIRYNLGDKSFEKIWSFLLRKYGGGGDEDDIDYCRPMYAWFEVFNCIQSISSV